MPHELYFMSDCMLRRTLIVVGLLIAFALVRNVMFDILAENDQVSWGGLTAQRILVKPMEDVCPNDQTLWKQFETGSKDAFVARFGQQCFDAATKAQEGIRLTPPDPGWLHKMLNTYDRWELGGYKVEK